MSDPTLFCERLPEEDRSLRLGKGEASHARALRLGPGDRVRVTDGRGRVRWGRVREVEREGVRVDLEEDAEAPADLPAEVAFGVANKKRTLWLVEKAVELGALGLQPLELRRSRSVADAGRSAGFWRKAERRAVSALKQCGGARLPDLRPVCDLQPYLEHAAAVEGPAAVLDPGGSPLREELRGWRGERPARLLLGPEGGLTPEEVEAARDAGFAPAALGPRNLRFETAAVAALGVAAQQLEEAGKPRPGGDGDTGGGAA